MYKPLVSILIPVYNREEMLKRAVDSALNQSYDNIEVIISDNASTDGTWEVCKYYAKKDKRVKIYRNEKNLGPVLNWKRCIDEATGELGKILFSDDAIYEDYLEKTVPILEDNEVGFVYTKVHIGPEIRKGSVTYEYFGRPPGKVLSEEYLYDILHNFFYLVSPGAALFRLKDLKNNLVSKEGEISLPNMEDVNDFNSHGAGPDVLLYLLTAINYKYIAWVDEPLAFFCAHSGNISADSDNILQDRYFRAMAWFAFHNRLSYWRDVVYQVSVIVPMYNDIEEIIPSVETLLKSTHVGFEIIIVMDKRTVTTESREKCMELYGKKYKSVRIYEVAPDINDLTSILEFGIRVASGAYILFNEAKTKYRADSLAGLFWGSKIFGIGKIDVVFQNGYYLFVNDDQAVEITEWPKIDKPKMLQDSKSDRLNAMFEKQFLFSLRGNLYKRDFLLKHIPYVPKNLRSLSEMFFSLEFMAFADTVVLVPNASMFFTHKRTDLGEKAKEMQEKREDMAKYIKKILEKIEGK